MRAAFPPQINDNPAAILLLSGSILTAGECRKMPPKKEPAHADKPRTPITIIRLEGLKCQEESA